jgi:hypothetical protein
MRMKSAGFSAKIIEPISKSPGAPVRHSERSEESPIFNRLRSFTSFRMTGKIGFGIGSGEM